MAVSPTRVRVILSGVRSVTHLVYAASWLRHLLAETTVPVEVVVLDVGAGFGRARVDERQVRDYLPEDPRLTVTTEVRREHWEATPGVARVLLSIGAPGTRAWGRLVVTGRGRRPRVVVVDEGIGSFGDRRTRRDAYRRQGGRGPWPAVRAGVVTAAHRLLTDVHWSLYERVDGRWEVVADVAAEFRRRLSGVAADPGSAVYLTQPWPDIGVMSEPAYLAHLAAVRDACAAHGVGLLLRPHPSEDRSRYAGFALSEGTVPAELAREVAEAPVVIGSNSTALLNLAAVHGARAVRVTAPELEPLEAELSERQSTLLDAFLPASVPVAGLRAALDRGHPRPRPADPA
ncbi:hypothetical protein N865_11525 [Intrasporangium oryzae NRRL B-24470]|uniref:Uncharacterized protein n=1 Tax=Intrasporangium oryzae NRRL B-24470 TaxID=1386089 RepID=W9G4T9_9MICO|nr:polysialyltransferase family glycosyltransferase [Intrasporangium oryzae]EWT01156.1 hypothetical protein N865_11525 [Intrasporangium oryzae NRRL B-24470]